MTRIADECYAAVAEVRRVFNGPVDADIERVLGQVATVLVAHQKRLRAAQCRPCVAMAELIVDLRGVCGGCAALDKLAARHVTRTSQVLAMIDSVLLNIEFIRQAVASKDENNACS